MKIAYEISVVSVSYFILWGMHFKGKNENWQNQRAKILHVFDIAEDYLKTLDIGRSINHLCCDEDSKRIIMNLDSEYQLGYLDIEKDFNN